MFLSPGSPQSQHKSVCLILLVPRSLVRSFVCLFVRSFAHREIRAGRIGEPPKPTSPAAYFSVDVAQANKRRRNVGKYDRRGEARRGETHNVSCVWGIHGLPGQVQSVHARTAGTWHPLVSFDELGHGCRERMCRLCRKIAGRAWVGGMGAWAGKGRGRVKDMG
jgi:hypothetical protein